MEIFLTFLGGVFGIVGAFAGAWAAHRYERQVRKHQNQKDTTIALYNEYQSPDMLLARIRARNILTSKEGEHLTLSELREQLDSEQWLSVAMVITFFEKLGVLLENNYLDPNLSKELLQYDFRYWYQKYFSRLIIRGEQSGAQWWRAIRNVASQWL